MSDRPVPHSPDERDAHLRAALRYAPDRDVLPPAALRAQILAAARRPVKPAPANDRRLLARLSAIGVSALERLARPSGAAAFASLVLATVIGLMWRDGPPDPEAERAPHTSATAPMQRAKEATQPTTPTAVPAAPPATAAAPASVDEHRVATESPKRTTAPHAARPGAGTATPSEAMSKQGQRPAKSRESVAEPQGVAESAAGSSGPDPAKERSDKSQSAAQTLAGSARARREADSTPEERPPPGQKPAPAASLFSRSQPDPAARAADSQQRMAPISKAASAADTSAVGSTAAKAPAPSLAAQANPLAAVLATLGRADAATTHRWQWGTTAARTHSTRSLAWLADVQRTTQGAWRVDDSAMMAGRALVLSDETGTIGRLVIADDGVLWQAGATPGITWRATLPEPLLRHLRESLAAWAGP